MRNLFLASYFAETAGLLPEFAGDPAGKRVAFIPTASLPEKIRFYVRADKKALERLGMIVEELEVSKLPREEIAQHICAADCVFVAGGNTFFLLQELRRSGADALLLEHIAAGKLYIGSSAGSVVLAQDIGYLRHMDSPKAAPLLREDFTGLGAVEFCVVPHCANAPFKKAAAKICGAYARQLDLRPIHNGQAILVRGETATTGTI